MRKRVSLPLLFAGLLLALYLAPQLPAVRGWLLQQADGVISGTGYELDYRSDRGNPWTGLTLEGVAVSGPGVGVSAEELSVGYFLPGLLTRTLPLSVTARGVRGSLTLSDLSPAEGDANASVQPVLRDLLLEDVAVTVTDIPYTLPDFTLSEVRARSQGEGFTVEALVTTDEGAASLDGSLTLNPFGLEADVTSADVRLARQWWDGVESGTASGHLSVQNGQIEAEAELEDGTIRFLDEVVTNISGPVVLDYPKVEGDLTGKLLGGTVSATLGVAIDEARWFGEAQGEVDLRDTALWLAEGRLPLDLSTLPMSGRADATVRATGWTEVDLAGTATGMGSVAGYVLDDLAVAFDYSTAAGVSSDISARLAGGTVTANLEPAPGGFDFALDGTRLALLPATTTDVEVRLASADGALGGITNAEVQGTLLGEPLGLELAGTVESGTWSGDLNGNVLAGTLNGTVDYADGRLASNLTGNAFDPPFVSAPVNLQLSGAGPPSDLPLTLAVSTPEPGPFDLGTVQLGESVDGTLTAVLRGTTLGDLQGELGPLSFSGEADLGERRAALSYALSETPVRGSVNGRVALDNGTLTYENSTLQGEGSLAAPNLSAAGVTLPPLDGEFTYSYDDNLELSLDDPEAGVTLALDGDALTVDTDRVKVNAFGQAFEVNGSAALAPSRLRESLDLNLQTETPWGPLELSGPAEALEFGFRPSLLSDLEPLTGQINLPDNSLTLSGALGTLGLQGDARFGDTLSGEFALREGDDLLTINLGGTLQQPDLRADGSLSLQPLANVLGLPLSGRLDADLRRQGDAFTGSARVTGESAGIPFDLTLRGDGPQLALAGSASPAPSLPLALSGTLYPDLRVTASHSYGSATLAQEEAGWHLSGSGNLPGADVGGFVLDPQAWQLSGDLQSARLELPASGSVVRASLDGSGWRVNADLNQSLSRGDTGLLLEANAELSTANPNGQISGDLILNTPERSTRLPLTGSLAALRLGGRLEAATLNDLAGLPLETAGSVAVDGTLRPVDGDYRVDLAWQAEGQTLDAEVVGDFAGSPSLTATAPGLTLSYTDNTATLSAHSFDPSPYFPQLEGALSGTLQHGPDTWWAGELELSATDPLDLSGVSVGARLTGKGDTLSLDAQARRGRASLSATGRLLPHLELALGGTWADLAALQGSVTGTPSQPVVTATLTSAPFEIESTELKVPSQVLELTAQFEERLQATVTGENLQLTFSDNTLQGTLGLPFALAGQTHILDATLAGPVSVPRVDGRIQGNVVSGPLTFSDDRLTATLDVDGSPWLSGLPVALGDSRLGLELSATTALDWQAEVEGSASFQTLPLTLASSLSGSGTSYRGAGILTLAGEPIAIEVTGDAGAARVTAGLEAFDLAAIAPLVPADVSGSASGTLSFDTQQEPSLTYALSARGDLAGQAFNLTALSGEAGTLLVEGSVADTDLVIEAIDGSSYRLAASRETPLINLDGVLTRASTWTLSAAGQLGTQPLRLEGEYAPASAEGRVAASFDGIDLSAEAKRADETWTLSGTLLAPEDSILPLAGKSDFHLSVAEGEVVVDALTLAAAVSGNDIALDLDGPAWPSAALQGNALIRGFDPLELSATGTAAEGYTLTLTQNALALSTLLSPTFTLDRATLDGAATLPFGPGLELDTNLTWHKGAGFEGEAHVTLDSGPLELDALATGTGNLNLEVTTNIDGAALATATLQLSDNPLARPELAGEIVLAADAGNFFPNLGQAARATGELEVSGTLQQPRVSGPVALQGPFNSAGSFTWHEGTGQLTLSGDSLDAAATLNASGWNLSGQVNGFDLGPFLPQVASPRLDAAFEGSQRWGETPALRTEDLTLTLPNSRVSGTLTYNGGVGGRLQTELDLADLQLGTALQGQLGGSVSLTSAEGGAPRLGGVLEADRIGLAGNDALLSGSVIINGSLSAPDLTARLRGEGEASGNLFAAFTPGRQTYQLISTLTIGQLASDLRLQLTEGETTVSGGLTYGDFALSALPQEEERLAFAGHERLAGWRLTYDPAAQRLGVTGDLASLNSALTGGLALSARYVDGAPFLTGSLSHAQVGPVALGTIDLASSPEAPRELAVSGDALAGTVALRPDLAWTLERLGLGLPAETQVQLSGSGTRSSAALSGELSTDFADERATLPVSLTYENATLELTSRGEVYGGTLELAATGSPAAGWRGTVSLADARYAGTDTTLSGELSGPFSQPTLDARFNLGQEAGGLAGDLSASPEQVTLNADLTSARLDSPLSVQGTLWPQPELELTSAEGRLTLRVEDTLLTPSGALAFEVGPLRIRLEEAANGGLRLRVATTLPALDGLALATTLPRTTLADVLPTLRRGLTLQGVEKTSGAVTLGLEEGLAARLEPLRWATPAGNLTLQGQLGFSDTWQGELSGSWTGNLLPEATPLPWLASLDTLSLQLALTSEAVRLTAQGEGSELVANYVLPTGTGALDATLSLAEGQGKLNLSYGPAGPAGTVDFVNFPIFASAMTGNALLDAQLIVDPEAATGSAKLRLGQGSFDLEGSLGLASVLPRSLAPQGGEARRLRARLNSFNLSNVPWVARAVPYLDAPVTGVVTLNGAGVVGEILSPDLKVGGRTLPLKAEFDGSLEALELRGTLERSLFTLNYRQGDLSGLIRFESFPLARAAEAFTGPNSVTAPLTGALRFELPQGRLADAYVRFASERFALTRDGVTTEGELSFELRDGGLSIGTADFVGAGRWRAAGEASASALNLRIDAEDADFGPLLALVPQFAGFDVGAFGSLQVVTSGSLVNPVVRATSSGLEFSVGASAYKLADLSLTVQNNTFVTSGRLEGAAPLTGELAFNGGGRLSLTPVPNFDAQVRFEGNPSLPVVGTLQDFSGVVSAQPGGSWRLDATGQLGQPFSLAGTINPLDLRLSGDNLNLKAPNFFLSSSATNTDLRFFRAEDGFHLAGSLLTESATLSLAGRPRSSAPTDPETRRARANNPFLTRILFDDVRLRAAQQITFQENFGSAELGEVDLVLSGSAAVPTLSGSAQALSGTLRYAGRDLTLASAVATFEPARGIFPALTILATTRFDKSQVLNGLADRISFAEPRDSPSFVVNFALNGEISPTPGDERAFSVDLAPTLSSEATIQTEGGAARPLTEPELFSLLTLGRLELSPTLAGENSLTSTLAQGAVDTAVDFLLLSQLQRELASALGLDLLEIRTTPLGSLLAGSEDRFGVSLRLGGYLSDELFASYEIGSLGVDDNVSFSNTFNLRYTLDRLEFSAVGKLDLYREAGFESAPELELGLGYALTPLVRLETGLNLSAAQQGLRFGVNFRW